MHNSLGQESIPVLGTVSKGGRPGGFGGGATSGRRCRDGGLPAVAALSVGPAWMQRNDFKPRLAASALTFNLRPLAEGCKAVGGCSPIAGDPAWARMAEGRALRSAPFGERLRAWQPRRPWARQDRRS